MIKINFSNIKRIIKKPIVFIPIIVIVIIAIIIIAKPKKNAFDYVEAKIGDVNQVVSVTGRVKAAENVDLAFNQGGRVAYVPVKVGDKVYLGQILAQIEASEISAQLDQANATLRMQQAKLQELQKGARPEEITIKELELQQAQQTLIDDYNNSINVINDAYTKASDAVYHQTDALFINDDQINPQLTFLVNDSELKSRVESDRGSLNVLLNSWSNEIGDLRADDISGLKNSLDQSKTRLMTVRSFLNETAEAVNKSIALSSADLASYKLNINTGLTNVNMAISSINSAIQLINLQELTVQETQNQLALTKAGATIEQMNEQQALVDQAQANVNGTQAQLYKSAIHSPINGIVSAVDIKAGEIAVISQPVISIISASQMEIETNVPEADIAKLKVGDKADVTLDAYGSDEIFGASVARIDPAEIIIDGVATYKTVIQFTKADDRVRSGMTANVDIMTANKNGVIVVPTRAVISKDGEKVVRILGNNNQIQEVKIVVGLRGSDGNVEIISGINAGDKVITSVVQ